MKVLENEFKKNGGERVEEEANEDAKEVNRT